MQRDPGFTLIELVLTMGVLLTLVALATPVYTGALERARVTRAIGDISTVAKEVLVHQLSRGCWPSSLAQMGRGDLLDPWGRAYVLGVVLTTGSGSSACHACDPVGCVVAGQRRLHEVTPINVDFDLYSVGRDGLSTAPLTSAISLDDVVRGKNGGYIGLASRY